MLPRIWKFLRSPPFLFLILVVAVSFIGRALPSPWDDIVRRANSLTILYFILWLIFQVRIYRDELRAHREEIMAMLQARGKDYDELQRTAADLVVETARRATKELSDQMTAAAEASRAAEHAANNSAVKLEDTKGEIHDLNLRLIEQGKESHDKLDTIEKVTVETNTIVKRKRK